MKHISKQKTSMAARRQMSGVADGDIVVVHIRGKDIPCVARMCSETHCRNCALRREDCACFIGGWESAGQDDFNGFIPLEDAVE